ncbi:MAG: TlpA family protein disulfide reductase [Pseudomonadota bacterium]
MTSFSLLVAALGLGLLSGCDDAPRTPEQAARKVLAEAARPVLDSPAPEFELDRLHGGRFTSAELRGKTTLLNFWAPWCPPCVQELPELSRLHRTIQTDGGQVIGIAMERQEDVQTFLADHPVTYPMLLGGKTGNDLMRRLGNTHGGLPYTVVIDPTGRIRTVHAGLLNEDRARRLFNAAREQ